MQTVRLVHTATNDDADWQDASKRRQTDEHWAVDRATGGQSGFAGYQTNAQPGPHATEWIPRDAGRLRHLPRPPERPGPEYGLVVRDGRGRQGRRRRRRDLQQLLVGLYGRRQLRADAQAAQDQRQAAGRVGAAVDKWNQQAAGPVEQRNAPQQEALPQTR